MPEQKLLFLVIFSGFSWLIFRLNSVAIREKKQIKPSIQPVFTLKTALPDSQRDEEFISIEISVNSQSESVSKAKKTLNFPVVETTKEVNIEKNSEESEPQIMFDKNIINEALQNSRSAIVTTIGETINIKRSQAGAYTPLYDLLMDYPLRAGKMLRPTICISVARAAGGMGHLAVKTASALELYHNAFLIHDDIEDGSETRRGKDTLHQMIGIPRAINVGDATNVLAVGLLLENLSIIGVSKTINILHEIDFMAQQSVEGQAMELDWVATNTSKISDQDYFTMCVKKTCWYSFITPCRLGLIIGHPAASPKDLVKPLASLTRFGMILGIAFQIQDDVLNLQGEIETYGKEIGGDI